MNFATSSPRYFKATIAYDGTDFLGFQIQASRRTVQGVIEAALSQIAKSPVRITGAGRTDTGVHASGQVVAFTIAWAHSEAKLLTALNVILPDDIVVLSLTEARADFHPRYSAKSRQYRYVISTAPSRDVFSRRYVLWLDGAINFKALQQASTSLLGTHDFATFGKPPQGNNTVRTIFQARWVRTEDKFTFELAADAFLYRMVRNIVGTLLQVGVERENVTYVSSLLLARDRSQCAPPVAPHGLFLVKVNY